MININRSICYILIIIIIRQEERLFLYRRKHKQNKERARKINNGAATKERLSIFANVHSCIAPHTDVKASRTVQSCDSYILNRPLHDPTVNDPTKMNLSFAPQIQSLSGGYKVASSKWMRGCTWKTNCLLLSVKPIFRAPNPSFPFADRFLSTYPSRHFRTTSLLPIEH